jgi:hypothetical protein
VGDSIYHSDGKTCEGAFLQGEPTAKLLSSALGPAVASAPMIGTPNQCTSSYHYCAVKYTVIYRDFLGITATDAETTLQWNYNMPLCPNAPALCATYVAGSFYPYGNPLTNWTQYARWNEHGINTQGPFDSVGYTGSAIMRNAFFPPCSENDPLYVRYDPVQLTGNNDGSFDAWESSDMYGGLCGSLLHKGTSFYTILSQ